MGRRVVSRKGISKVAVVLAPKPLPARGTNTHNAVAIPRSAGCSWACVCRQMHIRPFRVRGSRWISPRFKIPALVLRMTILEAVLTSAMAPSGGKRLELEGNEGG